MEMQNLCSLLNMINRHPILLIQTAGPINLTFFSRIQKKQSCNFNSFKSILSYAEQFMQINIDVDGDVLM